MLHSSAMMWWMTRSTRCSSGATWTTVTRKSGGRTRSKTFRPSSCAKRSHSRATQRKRAIAAQAIRIYNTDDVLQAAHSFIQAQADEWVNFSRVSQHLYERFYKLKPKHLGQPGKKYKSLLKFLADYPSDLALRKDVEKQSVYWIRSL